MPINISTSPALFRWKPACWMRVTGEDAEIFLQGQFSNDLRLLEKAPALYGLWLTLKGRILADSFVLHGQRANEFWIGSYFSPATLIRERLESHVIADDVVIEDLTSGWAGTSLMGLDVSGPTSGELGSSAFIFPGRRDSGHSLECVYPAADGEPGWVSELKAGALDEEEMTRCRILAGIPAIPTEVGAADLPQEAGLEADAISYTKGCYLGQEVMARLKSMGQVRRRLWRVDGAGEVWPKLPSPVFVGARQVGELRSAARNGSGGWLGMAMVSLMHVRPEMELSFTADGSPAMRLNVMP